MNENRIFIQTLLLQICASVLYIMLIAQGYVFFKFNGKLLNLLIAKQMFENLLKICYILFCSSRLYFQINFVPLFSFQQRNMYTLVKIYII